LTNVAGHKPSVVPGGKKEKKSGRNQQKRKGYTTRRMMFGGKHVRKANAGKKKEMENSVPCWTN